jgi:hypothetical protein
LKKPAFCASACAWTCGKVDPSPQKSGVSDAVCLVIPHLT